MGTEPPLLFALQGSQDYARRVAQRLGCRLSPHDEHEYEDGEHKCRPQESVNGRQVVVFHGLYGDNRQSVHDKLCRLLFFCAALKDEHIVVCDSVPAFRLPAERVARRLQILDTTAAVAALLADNYGLLLQKSS